MLTAVTGALAGVVHVLSGPDHLAAVAPLAVNDGRRAWLTGWSWGLGHASGVVLVAALAVVLRDLLPPVETIAFWSERLVGGALIAVGLWALRRGLSIRADEHAHGRVAHAHLHVHAGPPFLRRFGHAHASFGMGVLHGMAGSSHFFGVLPALALPSRADALTYIAAFGVATVLGMTAFTAALGYAGRRTEGRLMRRPLTLAAAALAFAVGGFWLAGAPAH